MTNSAIHIEAPSRLHFGLLALPGMTIPANRPAAPALPPRQFGGAGLMIGKPGISLKVEAAAAWSAQGPCAARALSVGQAVTATLNVSQPFAIQVERCPPEHIGLGTGTQLSLAVARAIALATDHADVSMEDLARIVGRGRRSAIGIHGFRLGGFLVDGGNRGLNAIAPLVARVPFPEDWAIVLIMPRNVQGAHGQRETEAFQVLAGCPPDSARTDALCRLLLLDILPALIEGDLDAFGEALHDYNRQAGEMFKPWQGGVYANGSVEHIIATLRGAGVKCVGHSSWGPTVFAVVKAQAATDLTDWLTQKQGFAQEEVVVTCGANCGERVRMPRE